MDHLRLIRYEWKKNFEKAFIWGIILLFSVLNIANIYYQYCEDSYFAEDNGWRDAYWELYDEFAGEITSEKLEKMKNLYVPLAQQAADLTFNRAIDPDSLTGINDFSDYLLLGDYYVADLERFCGYAEEAEETARIAAENVDLYNAAGNTYQARVNVKIYRLFHGRRITEFAYLEGYNCMTEYSLSSWLVLLVCLFAASGLFAGEREAQMDHFLKTTRNGYRATASAKLAAALLFAVLISLWFSLVDYCGFGCVYGFAGAGGLPVYALPDFTYSLLGCKLWQYFLLSALSRALGAVFFTLLCSLLSLFFTTSLVPFLLGCALTGGACLLAENTQEAYRTLWRVCNPAFLIYGKALYRRTEYLNLFGEPIAAPLAALCGGLILCGVLAVCIRRVYCRGGLL